MDGAGDKQVSHVTDCVSVIASFPDLLLLTGEGEGGGGGCNVNQCPGTSGSMTLVICNRSD